MKKKELLVIFLLLVCALPSVFPLFHHGFFQTDDGEWMIIRLSAFYQALHDGQFPVRFLQRLNFGYGYPVAEFLYPGSFYAGTILHVIRFGFVNSVKIIFGLSLMGSAFFTYFWLRKLFSKFSSFLGALFSLYLPYHLYDVYTRGSIEVFALLWVPFIFWQIERKSMFWVSIGIGLLLISHNTIALLFLPILFIYGWLRKLTSIRLLIASFLFGILLASFFIIPAVLELHNTIFSQTAVSNPLGYFASVQLIGYSVLLVLLATPFSFFLKNKLINDYKKVTLFFLGVSLLALFLSISLSSLLWHLPFSLLIQFPFRVLSYFVVSIAFLSSYLVSAGKKWQQWITSAILLLLLVYSAIPYNFPKAYFDIGEGYYYTNEATTTVQDEYMPVWVKQKPIQHFPAKVVLIKGEGSIQNIVATNNKISFVAEIRKDALVQINTLYWPGWAVSVDNISHRFTFNNEKGVIQFSLSPGRHIVQTAFAEDPLRLISDIISFISFVILIWVTRVYNKKK